MNAEAEIENVSEEDVSTENTQSVFLWVFAIAGLVAVVFHMLV